MVDLGADVSFQDAQKKIYEHYKIEVPTSAVQSIVENHAQGILEYMEEQPEGEMQKEGVAQLIAEIDGSMIPIVDTSMPRDGSSTDHRKVRSLHWKEARLCFARDHEKVTPVFDATMQSVEKVGDLLYRSALRAGLGEKTKVHGTGDGAKWIEMQMSRVFGKQLEYLIDFFHVSEYLGEAAEHSWTSEKKIWLKRSQELLKENRYNEILDSLRRRIAPEYWQYKEALESRDLSSGKQADKEPSLGREETAVEKCYRYIDNRKNSLNYRDAIVKGLPIGSGEIESAHRYVIQKRLKIAGAWWRAKTVDHMLALRVLRANGDWDKYWESRKAA